MILPLWGCGVGGALFKAIFLRSGALPREEIRQMEAREVVMLRELPERTILVLSVGILDQEATPDAEGARMLAQMLRDQGFPGARAGARSYRLPFPRQPNQAWIYWKRLRALSDSITANPPGDADYILAMDVLGGTRDDGTLRGIGGIHVYGFTGAGDPSYGRLRNSVHPIFKEIEPGTLVDACTLVVQDLLRAREASGGGMDSMH